LEEDTQLTITPALAEKSHVASLFGAFLGLLHHWYEMTRTYT
jgi:hypothetical protein